MDDAIQHAMFAKRRRLVACDASQFTVNVMKPTIGIQESMHLVADHTHDALNEKTSSKHTAAATIACRLPDLRAAEIFLLLLLRDRKQRDVLLVAPHRVRLHRCQNIREKSITHVRIHWGMQLLARCSFSIRVISCKDTQLT
jgi:hypothetical protein